MKKFSFLIVFLIGFVGFSQDYKGALTTETKGLYKMLLTPEIRSACSDNFRTIRIKDSNEAEVPYVLMHNTDRTFSVFTPIKIKSKKRVKKSTSIVLENVAQKKQERITLRIANTRVNKSYDVFGSDNGKDWYGLVSGGYLSNINSTNQTFAEKTIDFPLNTYQFIRISFKDKKSLPINILEAGVYENKFLMQSPVEIEDFTQETILLKEEKKTQLKFIANAAKKINIISFDIDTEFFLRNAKIIVERTRQVKKRTEVYNDVIASFKLNSKNKNTFDVSNLNEKEFTIEIENQDNPALNISKVQFYQKPIYLIANLKEKESYNLVLDNKLSKPSYDLGNFISNKTKNVATANIVNFKKVVVEKQEPTEKPFWQTNLFMWVCIVLGGLLILYIAFGLLKDIGTEK